MVIQLNLTMIAESSIWNPEDCVGSAIEVGDNSGWMTWLNALNFGDRIIDQVAAVQDELKDHFARLGAWSDVEVSQWDLRTLAGRVVQGFSGSYRQLVEYGNDEGVILTNDNHTEWYYCVGE